MSGSPDDFWWLAVAEIRWVSNGHRSDPASDPGVRLRCAPLRKPLAQMCGRAPAYPTHRHAAGLGGNAVPPR